MLLKAVIYVAQENQHSFKANVEVLVFCEPTIHIPDK